MADTEFVTKAEFDKRMIIMEADITRAYNRADEAVREASRAAAGYSLLKDTLGELGEKIEASLRAQTAELTAKLDAHEAQIKQWQSWQRMIAGLLGALIQIPLWGRLGAVGRFALKWGLGLFAVAGVGWLIVSFVFAVF